MGDVANLAVICRGRRPRRPGKRKPFLQRKMAIKQRIFHRHDITKTPFVIRVAEDVDPYKIISCLTDKPQFYKGILP